MKIEVLSQRENPLLHRKEVRFTATYVGAVPSVKDIRAGIISALHSKDNLTVIDGVKQSFGEKRLNGYAKVYADEKATKIEHKHRLNKNFGKKEDKAAVAPAAPAAAEGPKVPEGEKK